MLSGALSGPAPTGLGIMSNNANTPGAPIEGNALHQHILDMINKRISTMNYLRKAHEGRVYWFNTLRFDRPDLARMPYFDARRLARRATNYMMLGLSLPAVVDLYSDTAADLLRSLAALLAEFEQFQQLRSEGSYASSASAAAASSLSRAARLPNMFRRAAPGVKSRRSNSTATAGSSDLGIPALPSTDNLPGSSSGGSGSISGPHTFPLPSSLGGDRGLTSAAGPIGPGSGGISGGISAAAAASVVGSGGGTGGPGDIFDGSATTLVASESGNSLGSVTAGGVSGGGGISSGSFSAGPSSSLQQQHMLQQSTPLGAASSGAASTAFATYYDNNTDLLPGEEYTFLLTPSLPFDPDFFETFSTLCDVLIDCYQRVLALLPTPRECSPAIMEQFSKTDARVRKLLVQGAVKEFEEYSRSGVKAEVANVGKVVLAGLM